jgi:hypothetical protein
MPRTKMGTLRRENDEDHSGCGRFIDLLVGSVELEAMGIAILVQHMVNLQTALGTQTAAQLDAYLEHEFVSHMSVLQLAHPPARMNPEIPAEPLPLAR